MDHCLKIWCNSQSAVLAHHWFVSSTSAVSSTSGQSMLDLDRLSPVTKLAWIRSEKHTENFLPFQTLKRRWLFYNGKLLYDHSNSTEMFHYYRGLPFVALHASTVHFQSLEQYCTCAWYRRERFTSTDTHLSRLVWLATGWVSVYCFYTATQKNNLVLLAESQCGVSVAKTVRSSCCELITDQHNCTGCTAYWSILLQWVELIRYCLDNIIGVKFVLTEHLCQDPPTWSVLWSSTYELWKKRQP